MKSWNEMRKAATAFSKRWKDAFDEKSQAQSFLKEFFAVFGVDAVTIATFRNATGANLMATVNYHRYAKQSSAELIAEGAIS